jgi:hypothetical protein
VDYDACSVPFELRQLVKSTGAWYMLTTVNGLNGYRRKKMHAWLGDLDMVRAAIVV